MSEDAGIKPKGLLRLWHWQSDSNHSARSHPPTTIYHPHSARSHPHSARFHPITRLDLIHPRLECIHTRIDLIHTRLDLIHSRLDLISSTTLLDLIQCVSNINEGGETCICQLDSCKEKLRIVTQLLHLPNSCPRHYCILALFFSPWFPLKWAGTVGADRRTKKIYDVVYRVHYSYSF